MRYKIFSIIALLIFSHSMSWAVDKPLIDKEFKDTDEKIEQLTIECEEKEKNRFKQYKCRNKVFNKYEKEGKIRGTEEYCEFNYINLGFNELETLFKKLKQQQRTARSSLNLMWDDELPGEVTKEDLQTEIIWIESRLAKMQKKKIKKLEKSME